MGFIKNILWKKQDISEEEREKLNQMLYNNEESSEDDEYINDYEYQTQDELTENDKKNEELDIYDIIERIKPEQINKLRNLLDKKEKELESETESEIQIEEIPVKESLKHKEPVEDKEDYSLQSDAISEFDVKENITYDEINYETYDTEDEKEIMLNDDENASLILKIKEIFGDENVEVKKDENQLTYDFINEKPYTCIGVRNKQAFNSQINMQEQNSWFISNIKKIDELKNFKMLKSENGIKDLVWDKEKPLLICYRSIDNLDSEEDFSFPVK